MLPLDLSITCDTDYLEFNIFGSAVELKKLGITLKNINNIEVFELNPCINNFYPMSFVNLILILDRLDISDRVEVNTNLSRKEFILSGNVEAFNILGDSILGFATKRRKINDHFHIDFISEILSNDEIDLIVGIDR